MEGRDSIDPKNRDLSGVAMEGSGFLEPAFHGKDAYLRAEIRRGYRVLNLDHWDERTRSARFVLGRFPVGDDDNPLRLWNSAAVRPGNALIRQGECLAIYRNGEPGGPAAIFAVGAGKCSGGQAFAFRRGGANR